MTSDLKYNPKIPQEIITETINESKIIPITTVFTSGDVMFKGLGNHNLIDIDFGGEHDFVFNTVTNKIDRFVVNNKYGSDFVVGWLYQDDSGMRVYVREDVSQLYPQGEFSDDPTDINEKYDAYENI